MYDNICRQEQKLIVKCTILKQIVQTMHNMSSLITSIWQSWQNVNDELFNSLTFKWNFPQRFEHKFSYIAIFITVLNSFIFYAVSIDVLAPL